MPVTDVVVVGLGPAGIVATSVLATAGYSVTAIQTATANSDRCPVASPSSTIRRRAWQRAVPAPYPQQGADAVGGSKLLAAPQSYRLDPWNLRARSSTLTRYGASALPADADLADWPFPAGELDEYHQRVERAMNVGVRPTATWTRRMATTADKLGWNSFTAPAAASTDCSSLLDRARAVGHVDLLADAAVLGIETDSSGAVSGVRYVRDGEVCQLSAPAVVLAASVVSNARLLLLSGITARGQVGRYFMAHNCFVANGWFPGTDLGRDAAGPATATAVTSFEGDEFDHTGLGFLGGSILQAAMTGPRTDGWRAAVAATLPDELSVPDRATGWIREQQHSIGTVWAQPDQLPRAENRIDLDPTYVDALGRPVPRLTLDLAEDDHSRAAFLGDRMQEWLRAAGAHTTWVTPLVPQPLGTHLYGGTRMGLDPNASVVDGYGRCHDVPGLVVVGSSTFPGTGGRGPVQTIEALAWRSAERLTEDLR
ncbi:GMC oxidoreductase [Rhodococcus sp. IEGM 1379]|uniref:GMC oxidoreductase n=1 Tax=Rhodococcus sp. IEGM 1379 TaxID=3047086 RepID=UPI0024B87366|nr:GMC oxidoreductase [Rhodococcus sp. IEGM 1379]MDI9913984.1 GMC oxidoreductase [Rhodococcus sp. IEGM 1379]